MVYLHVRQHVEDYGRWREGFDKHLSARQAAGATDEVYVMRDVDNPGEVTVILGWRSLEEARAFSQSNSLKEAMQDAGVTGVPTVRYLDMAD